MTPKRYTRKELITICDSSIVPVDRWHDRDSFHAQVSVATIRAMLLAGCKYRICRKGATETNERTIWIEIKSDEWEDGARWHLHYMPTIERIKQAHGSDWY